MPSEMRSYDERPNVSSWTGSVTNWRVGEFRGKRAFQDRLDLKKIRDAQKLAAADFKAQEQSKAQEPRRSRVARVRAEMAKRDRQQVQKSFSPSTTTTTTTARSSEAKKNEALLTSEERLRLASWRQTSERLRKEQKALEDNEKLRRMQQQKRPEVYSNSSRPELFQLDDISDIHLDKRPQRDAAYKATALARSTLLKQRLVAGFSPTKRQQNNLLAPLLKEFSSGPSDASHLTLA